MRASQAPTERRIGTNPPNAPLDGAGAPLALGRYRLQRRLGAGAFGTVWQAHDERLEREVAIKIVPRERVVGSRFEREARAAARLAHPGIVTLYEAGTDDDGAYLVSELVRGPTLDALLDDGRLSDRDILRIGIALCDALVHAHAHGVVHRDVKPSNILIPDRPVTAAHPAKLTDFGVARVLGGDTLTRTGDVVGTAAYMAPEQAAGLEASAPADLYALALVLYEALTGVNPVCAGTAAQRARRLGAHLPPLRRQRRDLPRELGRGLDLALRPKPRERGTIGELRAALEESLQEVGDDPGIVTAPWRPSRRASQAPEQVEWAPTDPARSAPAALAAEDEPETGPESSTPPAWPERGLAALAAAAATAWLLAHALGAPPIAPVAGALLAAAAILVLPRIGWLGVTAALVLAAVVANHPGAALVIACAAALPPLALFRAGVTWPLSVGAPALGALGLAGAWPALAARAASPWRRAELGLIGWAWLALASPLAGKGLYLPLSHGTPPPGAWTTSLYDTVHHVLSPLLASGTLAPAPVWALAAVLLPYLVNGRSLALDTVRVIAWAAALLSASGAVLSVAGGAHGPQMPSSALLGALAAAAIALAPTAFATLRGSIDR